MRVCSRESSVEIGKFYRLVRLFQNLMDRVNLKEKELNEEKMREDRRIYRREIELSTKEDLLSREADR